MDDVTVGLGGENVPCLRFAVEATRRLVRMRIGVIGMHLHGEWLRRINKLGQQGEFGAVARKRALSNECSPVLLNGLT